MKETETAFSILCATNVRLTSSTLSVWTTVSVRDSKPKAFCDWCTYIRAAIPQGISTAAAALCAHVLPSAYLCCTHRDAYRVEVVYGVKIFGSTTKGVASEGRSVGKLCSVA